MYSYSWSERRGWQPRDAGIIRYHVSRR